MAKFQGQLAFESRGSGFDYVITTQRSRHTSGPFANKELAAEAAQAYADKNNIQLPDLELAEGDRGAQQIQEF